MASERLTADRVIALLAPVLDRVRRTDHWVVPHGGSPSHRSGQRLTDGALLNHVGNLHRLGACPMQRGSSTTRLAVLDMDSHKGETSWPEMLAAARRLIDVADIAYSIRFIPFRSSGGKGLHLFAIWSEEQDARSVRAALAGILEACGFTNGTKGIAAGQVEIFPKQPSVPADGWGNMFVLPMTGQSAPLDPATLAIIDLQMVEWPDSSPVTYVAPPPAVVRTAEDTPELARTRSALFAIDPNELDYGGNAGAIGWLEILFAVHAATDGSAEGLALMLEWSSQWTGFDADASAAETEKQWHFAKTKPGGIGPGTLFRRAIVAGWVDPARAPNADGFEVIEVDEAPAQKHALLSTDEGDVFQITGVAESRGVPGNMNNIAPMLQSLVGDRIAYDGFRDELILRERGEWRRYTDEDTALARIALENSGVTSAGADNTRAAMHLIGRMNTIDSAVQWLESLPDWDGTPRVERFLPGYLGAPDNPYTRAVSRYLLTAIVGRVMAPGSQADMVPVLVGGQGTGKTRSVRALAPTPAHYAEIDLSKRDDDQARLLRGKIIGEIAELRGLSSRDHESIKAWITRTHEEWTPKYRETNTIYARRCIFVGTTNQDEFLADETGNRRWLPVRVGVCQPELVAADREQLLAEALVLWRVGGIDYREAEQLAVDEHQQFAVIDSWDTLVNAFVNETEGRNFTLSDVFTQALRADMRSVNRSQEMRMGRVLRDLGCAKVRVRDADGNRAVVWYKVQADARPGRAADIL